MLNVRRVLGMLCVAVLMPMAAYAQASLAGVVRDASGAVLPGVTVEAASPVLIERIRTAVTDGSGQYRIIDLRPGVYTVEFSLTGFTTTRREAVQLSGELVTTVNAELRVGGVQETITVTGAAPTIDVQTTTRQQVISREEINLLPTGRNYNGLGQMLTGVATNAADVGGSAGDPMASLTVHGSRPGDQRVMQNGVNTMTLQAGGNIGIAVPNPGMAAEVTVDTSGASAELSTGGIRINYIPRDGGNQVSGTTFLSFANSDMQADNLTANLRSRGVTSVDRIKTIYDINPGVGGPLRRDRLWFYATARLNRADNFPANAYYNKNAYDPTKWTYEADLSRPASNYNWWGDAQLRLTGQISSKNKVAFTWDQQSRCSCPGALPTLPWNISATTSPEAAGNMRSPMQRLLHAEWNSPVTNNLLIEAVALHRSERWGFQPNSTTYTHEDVINAQQEALLRSGGLIPVLDAATGRFYRATWLFHTDNLVPNYFYRAAVTYASGAHQFKAGFTNSPGFLDDRQYNPSPISYIAIPGAPITIIRQTTWSAQPKYARIDQRYDLGIFAQDRWTMNRLTLNLGVRFDAFNAGSPEQLVPGSTPLTPNRADFTVPETDFASWKDITPRLGAIYDLTGDGKTALKASLNKYLQSQTAGGLSALHPLNRMVNEATRVWFNGGSANLGIPVACDLTNPAPNGACLGLSNPLFGQNDPNATQYSRDAYFGWGRRAFNWEFSVGVQREVMSRVSLDVGYFRRWYGNWTVIDNVALAASDYSQFTVTGAPTLAAGLAGSQATAFDASSNVQRRLIARASDYGEQSEQWHGVDISVNARLQNGLMLFGGVSTGRTAINNCEVVAAVPESLTQTFGANTVAFSPENCDFTQPFLTQFKANGSYTVPKIDVLLSLTYQGLPGPAVRADTTVTERAPGQPLRGVNTTLLVPLQTEYYTLGGDIQVLSTEYGDRLNQLDFRVGKLFRFGRTRATLNLDLYNLFNRNAVTGENLRAEAYRVPTTIQLARFVKVGAQIDF
ncbi:MAG: carboxypeptidase regulatory-like domain-containing protein [Vicinamibacterales bacterium]